MSDTPSQYPILFLSNEMPSNANMSLENFSLKILIIYQINVMTKRTLIIDDKESIKADTTIFKFLLCETKRKGRKYIKNFRN